MLLAQVQALFKLAQGGGLLVKLLAGALGDALFGGVHLLLQVGGQAFADFADDLFVNAVKLAAGGVTAGFAPFGAVGVACAAQQAQQAAEQGADWAEILK